MHDEMFVFNLVFFVFSYKLLFWSERNISLGSFLLTGCCALAVTQLVYPRASRVFLNAFTDKEEVSPPDAPDVVAKTKSLLLFYASTLGLI